MLFDDCICQFFNELVTLFFHERELILRGLAVEAVLEILQYSHNWIFHSIHCHKWLVPMCDHLEPFPQLFQVPRFMPRNLQVHRSCGFDEVRILFNSNIFVRLNVALLNGVMIRKVFESWTWFGLIVGFIHKLANIWCLRKLHLVLSEILLFISWSTQKVLV